MSDMDPNDRRGRIVLVTGGSRGLGRHFVRRFAAAGDDVYFTYQSNEDEGRVVESEARAAGHTARALQLDVRDEDQAKAVIADIERASGAVQVLINNAGVSYDGMCWKLPAERYRDTLDVNVVGAFIMTKTVLAGMRESRRGRIVNISSVVAKRGIAGTVAYAASKSALFGMTQTAAKELAGRGITVNCMVVGYFDAGMGAKLPADIREQTLQSIPAGRFGDPAKLAEIVAFLCSDACDYVTGQEVVVDGGFLC